MEVPNEEEDNIPVTKSWTFTQMKEVKFTHTWTIDKFSHRCRRGKVGEGLKSSFFYPDTNPKRKWQLLLYPNGRSMMFKEYISLVLELDQYHAMNFRFRAKYKLSILNAKGEKTQTKEQQHEFFSEDVDLWYLPGYISKDFLLDKTNGLLPNDTLTIFCEIWVEEKSKNINRFNNEPFQEHEGKLSDDLGKLFEEHSFADVTLSVGDQKFHVHKAVLAARSPVFAAMFKNDWNEGKQNIVDITDVDGKVLQEMLRFIYTGKVIELEKVAMQLLEAANKYALDSLKVMCEKVLCASLTIGNVIDKLILADLHQANLFKAQAIAFINTHAREVLNSPNWQLLYSSHPDLLAEAWMIQNTSPPCKRVKRS